MTINPTDYDAIDPDEVLATHDICKTTPRKSAGGTWASDTIAGHRFDALVFPEPAENREWEVGGDSQISKLWVQRICDQMQVNNWDRGADIEPQTAIADVMVGLLAAGLASAIFG